MGFVLPDYFEPSAYEYETAHLIWNVNNGSEYVSWPLAKTGQICVKDPTMPGRSKLDVLAALNGPDFKRYDFYGYSAGLYHEFIVDALPEHMNICIGDNVNISFGEATPLAHCLFWDDTAKWFDWDSHSSIRVLGCTVEMVELFVANAMFQYEQTCKFLPEFRNVYIPDYEAPDSDLNTLQVNIEDICTDIEPNRFYFHGVNQEDDTAACIQ